MDWEPIAGPSGAQPVPGPSGAQSSAAIDLTMSSSPDDAQLTWPTDSPAAQQSCQLLKQSSSEDDLPILKSLSPLSRLLLDTTITIRDQLLDNLNDWSLVGAIANPNIADAKRNALVQELRARTRHGVLRLSPGEIDVTSLPSSSAPSTIGAEDNLIEFSPGPPQPQLVSECDDKTLLKVSESTYVAVTDVKGQSKDIKGKGKATDNELQTISIKITRTTLDPTGACQRLTANHPLPPAPRDKVTSKRGAAVAKLVAQDQLRTTFPIPSANEARELKDAIVILYDVYVQMQGKMLKSRFNAADKDVVAASAMFDGEASKGAKRRFRRIDHAASSAAALVAHFFTVVRGTGAGQGMQSQTAKQVGAFIAWNALAASFEGDPQHGVIKKMIDQKFSAEALTLSLRDAPKMLAVDHPHLATQPTNAVVNASTYNDVISHPSFQPAFAILRASALSIATQMSAHGRSVTDITHICLLYTLLPNLDRNVRAALTASRTSVSGRPPVTAGLRPIADDEAISANSNAISTLWTGVAHHFLKEKIREELARLNTAGLVNQPDQVTFNKSRSGLAFYAQCTDCTARPSHGALSDAHHLRTAATVMSKAAKSSSSPFLPPVRDDPIFGNLDFAMHGSGLPTAKLAVGILTQQHELVSLVETFASVTTSILSCRVTDSSMPLSRMKRGAFGDASISISEQLAGGKNTIQSGAVSIYFTGANEKNDRSETFAGELATNPALGHLFLMAVYNRAENLPEPGFSQRVCDKAQQFFGKKGWLPGKKLSDFKSHVQDVIAIIQQKYSKEFTKLVALLSFCAALLQPAGTGFPDTFSGAAGLDALSLCARLLAKHKTHISLMVCNKLWVFSIHLLSLSAFSDRPATLSSLFEAACFASNLSRAGGTSAVVDIIAKLTSQFNYSKICLQETGRESPSLFLADIGFLQAPDFGWGRGVWEKPPGFLADICFS